MIARRELRQIRSGAQLVLSRRAFTSQAGLRGDTTTAATSAAAETAPNSRWLSDMRNRVAQGITKRAEEPKVVTQLKHHMSYLDQHWLSLSAGREGYLSEPHWRGLDKHNVAWGDMVRLFPLKN